MSDEYVNIYYIREDLKYVYYKEDVKKIDNCF